MEREEHRAKALEFIQSTEFQGNACIQVRRLESQVSDALYTFSELGLVGDLDSIDINTALRIWAIMEAVITKEQFPAELRM